MNTVDDHAQKFLLLFKLDCQALRDRIVTRRDEYMEVFSLKRTREHFSDIFLNRYDKSTIHDLAHCSQDTIQALFQFYSHSDDIYWYLKVTEDMPATVEDELTRRIARLEKLYKIVDLFVNAELGVQEDNIAKEIDHNYMNDEIVVPDEIEID